MPLLWRAGVHSMTAPVEPCLYCGFHYHPGDHSLTCPIGKLEAEVAALREDRARFEQSIRAQVVAECVAVAEHHFDGPQFENAHKAAGHAIAQALAKLENPDG